MFCGSTSNQSRTLRNYSVSARRTEQQPPPSSDLTRMNAHSSRSHAIMLVKIEKSDVATEAKLREITKETAKNTKKRTMTCSTLYLVDLAGSERVKKTKATQMRLEEAKKINYSLLVLGNCIQSLITREHVNYRDSKLTRLLQDSLGGNAKTALVVTVTPSAYSTDETFSSLLFGQRCMKVKNKPVINKTTDYLAISVKLQDEVDKLTDENSKKDLELEDLRQELEQYRSGEKAVESQRKSLVGLENSNALKEMEKLYKSKIHKVRKSYDKMLSQIDKVLIEKEEKREEAEKETDTAKKRLSEVEEELFELKRENEKLNNRVNALVEENEELNSFAEDSAKLAEESKAEIQAKYEEIVEELKIELETYKASNTQLEAKFCNEKLKREEFEKEFKHKGLEKVGELADLKAILNGIKRLVGEDAEIGVEQLVNDNKLLRDQKNRVEKENEAVNKKYDALFKVNQGMESKIRLECQEQYDKQLIEEGKQREMAEHKLAIVSEQLKVMQGKFEAQSKKTANLVAEVELVKESNSKLKSAYEKATYVLIEKDEEIEANQQEIAKLKGRLAETEDRMRHFIESDRSIEEKSRAQAENQVTLSAKLHDLEREHKILVQQADEEEEERESLLAEVIFRLERAKQEIQRITAEQGNSEQYCAKLARFFGNKLDILPEGKSESSLTIVLQKIEAIYAVFGGISAKLETISRERKQKETHSTAKSEQRVKDLEEYRDKLELLEKERDSFCSVVVELGKNVLDSFRTASAAKSKVELEKVPKVFSEVAATVSKLVSKEIRGFREEIEERDDKIQLQNDEKLGFIREIKDLKLKDRSPDTLKLQSQLKYKEMEVERLTTRLEETSRSNRIQLKASEQEKQELKDKLAAKSELSKKFDTICKEKEEIEVAMGQEVNRLNRKLSQEDKAKCVFYVSQYVEKTRDFFSVLNDKLS